MAASISALLKGPIGSANSCNRNTESSSATYGLVFNGTILASGLLRYVKVSDRPAFTAWRIRPNLNRMSWVEIVCCRDGTFAVFIMSTIMFRGCEVKPEPVKIAGKHRVPAAFLAGAVQ